jgi:hypothetical protein
MNPYLEQADVWHDFHERFIPRLADLLTAQIDPRYIVKIDEHVYIHELSAEERRFAGRGDLTIAWAPRSSAGQSNVAVLEAPFEGLLPAVDVVSLSYLEIRDRRNRGLVTVIEVLSPANKKPGADRDQYLGKRKVLLASMAHFVEIDLLRGGARMPVENLPECDYLITVSRYVHRPRIGLWPIPLREPLPVIPIPLRDEDPVARLDLQQAIHHVYDAARYGNYIYTGEPDPPLKVEDAAWAKELLSTPVET